MAKSIIAGKLCESRSHGPSVAAVRPGVLTIASNDGASGFGDARPEVTAWQPAQWDCAKASPREDACEPPASVFVVVGLPTALLCEIGAVVQAPSVSTTRTRPDNFRIASAYRAEAAARQFPAVTPLGHSGKSPGQAVSRSPPVPFDIDPLVMGIGRRVQESFLAAFGEQRRCTGIIIDA